MEHSDKAKFILALHKHSLQAFDAGGTVLGGPAAAGTPNAVNPNQGLGGSIGGLLGLNNNFGASGANVQAGTNAAQLNQAYSGAQNGLQGQQNFADQAAAQGGFGNQAGILNQQQELANQLGQQAQGQGPNPAQAALNQSTGQNVQNQAALMASQRGASANPALMAREAAQQGAATQQQAVGQGATLQAQQQIAAQQALAGQQAQMQNVAANQIATQGQGANSVTAGQQGEQSILQGANTAANNANVGMQENINTTNAGVAAGNQKNNSGILGGLANAAGGVLGIFSEGGMAELPDHLHAAAKLYHPHMYADGGNVPAPPPPKPKTIGSIIGYPGFENGGNVEDKPIKYAPQAWEGRGFLASDGGGVKAGSPKEKAVKKDNSLKNDKVPALLSEGEIVIPRSIAMHPMAAEKAAQFVQAVLNKRKMGKAA